MRSLFNTPSVIRFTFSSFLDLLAAIFLNVDELIQVNSKFGETLKEAVEGALEAGDDDLTTVNAGKLFMDSMGMLRAYESYCTRQVSND